MEKELKYRGYKSIQTFNVPDGTIPMNEYIMNKETGKIELYFEKQDYLALPDEQKREISSNFLFSRKKNA